MRDLAAGHGQDGRAGPRAHRGAARSRTRCSATAAAASASPTPRSPRCRRAPSSRRPCDVASEGDQGVPGDHDPARRDEEGARPPGDDRPQDGRRRCSPRGARRSAIWSGTMIEMPRAALTADEIAETRRVLLVRHQRPDADDVRPVARRRAARSSPPTRRSDIYPVDPFVSDRPRRRRRPDEDGGREGPRPRSRS